MYASRSTIWRKQKPWDAKPNMGRSDASDLGGGYALADRTLVT